MNSWRVFIVGLVSIWLPHTLRAVEPPCVPAPPGLVTWFQFEESQAEDFTGLGAGSLPGQGQGYRGKALLLEGFGVGFRYPSSAVRESNAYTVACWFKRADLGNPSTGLIFSASQNTVNLGMHASGELFFRTPNFVPSSTRGITDDAWHHIALTCLSNKVAFYIDGLPAGDAQVDDDPTLREPSVIGALGALSGPGWFDVHALIDEFSLFNRALSPEEIAAAARNSDWCFTDLAVQADLVFGTNFVAGSSLTVNFGVTNRGTLNIDGADLRLEAGAGLTIQAVTVGDVAIVVDANSTTINLGSMAPGASKLIAARVRGTAAGTSAIKAKLVQPQPDLTAINDSVNVGVLVEDYRLDIAKSISVRESARELQSVVSLNYPLPRPLVVKYHTLNGTAVEGSDFLLGSGDVTMPAGETNATIRIVLVNDGVYEPNEDFSIVLDEVSGVVLGNSVEKFTILDGALPNFTADDGWVWEGDSGTNLLRLVVRLDGPATFPVSIRYTTDLRTNSTAVAGVDFVVTQGTLDFLPGETINEVFVQVLGNTKPQANRAFLMEFLPPLRPLVGPTFLRNRAVGVIVDDDSPPSVSLLPKLPGQQVSGDPFEAEVMATTSAGELATNYSGTVDLSLSTFPYHPRSVVISQVAAWSGKFVQLTNLTTNAVDISKWEVWFYDSVRWPAPAFRVDVPQATVVGPTNIFYIGGAGANRLRFTNNLTWGAGFMDKEVLAEAFAVLIRDARGVPVDFFCAAGAWPGRILAPQTIPAWLWTGEPVKTDFNSAFFRKQIAEEGSQWDWANRAPIQLRTPPRTTLPEGALASINPSEVILTNGLWKGSLSVSNPTTPFYVLATDASGNTGISNPGSGGGSDELVLIPRFSEFIYPGPGQVLGYLVVSNASQSTVWGAELTIEPDLAYTSAAYFFSKPIEQGTIIRTSTNVVVKFADIPPGNVVEVKMSISSVQVLPLRLRHQAYLSRGQTELNLGNNVAEIVQRVTRGSAAAPLSILGWWRGEGDTQEAFKGPSLTATKINYVDGYVGKAFGLGPDSLLELNAPSLSSFADTNDFAFDCWFLSPAAHSSGVVFLASKRDRPDSGKGWSLMIKDKRVEFEAQGELPSQTVRFTYSSQDTSRSAYPRDGGWHHLRLLVSRQPGFAAALALDGVGLFSRSVGQELPPDVSLHSDRPLQIGPVISGDPTPSFALVDEPTLIAGLPPDNYLGALVSAREQGKSSTNFVVIPNSPAFDGTTSRVLGTNGVPLPFSLSLSNRGPASYSGVLGFGPSSAGMGYLVGGDVDGAEPRRSISNTNSYLFEVTNMAPASTILFKAAVVSLSPRFNLEAVAMPETWFAGGSGLGFNFGFDLDGDGIADWWEASRGLSALNPADAAEDWDGDGVSNLDEYQADTSPADPGSVLRIGTAPNDTYKFVIQVQSVPGRNYQLEFRKDFRPENPWASAAPLAPGNGTVFSWVPDLEQPGFFRVSVTVP